jgi:hopanoid biosynthesis associated protein HpnK
MADRSPSSQQSRRLIINADDFGRSTAINQAVIRAHQQGVLTSASLMVNEPAFDEAVTLARANPRLGTGLHLTLLCGHSALPATDIAGLVNDQHEFTNKPAAAGWRYFFHRTLREQLRREIHEQFARFRTTGLPLDHLNGHLHLHLHPTIFSILMEDAAALGFDTIRLTSDPFWFNLKLIPGRWAYRTLHATIFGFLSSRARPVLRRRGLRHTQRVFGLLQHAHMDEAYLLKLLDRLPQGDSELYSHPSLDEFKHELDALVSPRVRARIDELGIQLIRYQDL